MVSNKDRKISRLVAKHLIGNTHIFKQLQASILWRNSEFAECMHITQLLWNLCCFWYVFEQWREPWIGSKLGWSQFYDVRPAQHWLRCTILHQQISINLTFLVLCQNGFLPIRFLLFYNLPSKLKRFHLVCLCNNVHQYQRFQFHFTREANNYLQNSLRSRAILRKKQKYRQEYLSNIKQYSKDCKSCKEKS